MIEALKTIEDWDVAQQLEGWDDQEVKQTYDQVVDLLTPEDIERDRSKVKITHTDNAENFEEFSDMYDQLSKLTPIKQVTESIAVYEVNGKRYATEHGEGGGYAIFYYAA